MKAQRTRRELGTKRRQEKRAASSWIVNAYVPKSAIPLIDKRAADLGNKKRRPVTRAEYLRSLIEADLGISFGCRRWGRDNVK